jgi:hypothetical protein
VIELLLLALTTPVPAGRVVVESATACPTAAEVDARLRVLLPAPDGDAPPKHATLDDDAGTLRVHLTGPDGAVLGDRTVVVEASCADRANVVAVVIAAWDVQQRAQQVDDPSLPHRAPPALPAPPTIVVASAPARAPERPTLELALGPAVTLVDGGAAPTAALAAGLWGRRFGARVALFGLWPRDAELGDGRARWTRVGATFELGARARGRAGRLDLHAGFVAGAVVAEGQGFELDHTQGGFSPGAVVGADWSYTLGRFFVGAGGALSAWTAQRLVSDATTPTTHALPRLQPSLDAHVGVVFP